MEAALWVSWRHMGDCRVSGPYQFFGTALFSRVLSVRYDRLSPGELIAIRPSCCGHCCKKCRRDRCGVCQQRRVRQRDALASPAGTRVCANSFCLCLEAAVDPINHSSHFFFGCEQMPHLPRTRCSACLGVRNRLALSGHVVRGSGLLGSGPTRCKETLQKTANIGPDAFEIRVDGPPCGHVCVQPRMLRRGPYRATIDLVEGPRILLA